ncbi:tetratricopeptide repeat protein [bacterium]|nr:tetratricopeptide repeat protein [bacterium]
MKRIFILTGCLLLFLAPLAAADKPGQRLAQARAAYDRGDYARAAADYHWLLDQGWESAELYYNLGNTEFKLNHPGRAMAYYRWAIKKAPFDDDIRYNLRHVRSFIRQPQDRSGPLTKLGRDLFNRFPGPIMAAAAWMAYLILTILTGGLIITRGRGTFLRWFAAASGVVFLFLAAWASVRLMIEKKVCWGVVVASQAEARNGPGPEYQVGFTVPEGREVRILGREKEWTAIGLPREGYKGWVLAQEVWADR